MSALLRAGGRGTSRPSLLWSNGKVQACMQCAGGSRHFYLHGQRLLYATCFLGAVHVLVHFALEERMIVSPFHRAGKSGTDLLMQVPQLGQVSYR